MKTKVIEFLRNLDYWAVYKETIMIDSDGNQFYIQDWESFEGFGYIIESKEGFKTAFIPKEKISQLDYKVLLESKK